MVAQARFADGGRRIELHLRPALPTGHPARLRLTGQGVAARYAVWVDDHARKPATRKALAGGVEIEMPSGGSQVMLSAE
jgi:hypothetical protein